MVPLYDSPEDVRLFMGMLYNSACANCRPTLTSCWLTDHFCSLSFDVRALDTAKLIAGPLRLAKKYMMDDLFARLVVILERDWPASYHDWAHIQEVLEDRMKKFEPEQPYVPYDVCYPDPGMLCYMFKFGVFD